MKAGGALVLTADAREAARRATGEARASLGGLSPTFAVLFASAHFFGSAQDLVTAVAEETGQMAGRRAAGALLFTCNGRGSRLFTEPDHDAGLVAEMLGEIPVAGFSCAGELGPVGGQNYLHAFTASIAVFPDVVP